MDERRTLNRAVFRLAALLACAHNVCRGATELSGFADDPTGGIAFMASATNYWAVDAARIKSIFDGAFGALKSGFPSESQGEVPAIACWFLDEPLPSATSIAGSNLWLGVKHDVLRDFQGSRAVLEDTNFWFAVARERRAFRPLREFKWYDFAGFEPGSVAQRQDGGVSIAAPAGKSGLLGGRPWIEIDENGLVSVNAPVGAGLEPPPVDGAAYSLAENIGRYDDSLLAALARIPRTARFNAMLSGERTAVVSNLVAIACLTEEELARTGLSPCVAPDDAVDPPSPSAAPGLL